jgi:ribonuclease HII
MKRAVLALPKRPDFVLVDGNPVQGLPVPSRAIVKGDRLSFSIGAASILAKTHRDLWMEKAAELYPGYGFEIHKGYCTKAHYKVLDALGPSPIHRMTFAPVKEYLARQKFEQCELF